MAENILTYILDLQGNLQSKLKQIGIENDKQLDTWAKVQKQVNSANSTINLMGKSIGSMNERIAALRAQKEWIPASNREAIRATNHEIEKLEKEIRKLHALDGGKVKGWFKELKSAIPGLSVLTNPLVAIGAAAYKTAEYVKNSKQAYLEESVATSKLTQIMQNTMGARQQEINSILDLTAAQQKLGVIGDETQLAGAQELATYLTKADNLKKLLPAMNDMLAQQYGLNASQEQAAQIGSMLGKVMQGQTGALSRYGYSFTKAQEHILKNGTEAQRAAILFDVVNEAVGGVNKALAETPEGKLKQQANNMGDLQERIGKLAVMAEATFSPVIAKVGEFIDKIVSFFEQNNGKIRQVIQSIVVAVTAAMDALWVAIKWVWDIFKGFIKGIQEGNPIFIGLAAVIGGVTTALILYKTWTTIVSVATTAWAGAQQLLNLILTLNPIGIIIAAIVALIAVIAYVAYTTEGWGTLWSAVWNFAKNTFFAFVEGVKLYYSTLLNGILIGLDKIKLGWYKFKEAMGIGDSSENQAAIAKINADVEARQQAIINGAKKVAEYANNAKNAFDNVSIKTNGKGINDVVGSLKSKLGIGTNEQLQNAVNGGKGGGLSSGAGSDTNTAIATGGTRNTTINIKIDDMIKQVVFNGSTGENVKEIERNFAEAFYRVLGIAEVSAAA